MQADRDPADSVRQLEAIPGEQSQMRIEGSSIRNLDRYLTQLPEGAAFVVAVPLAGREEWLKFLRFHTWPSVGDHFIPRPLGSVSRFNAYGKDTPRKSEPKVERLIIRFARWKLRNRWCHGAQYRWMKVWSNDHSPAPAERLLIAEVDGDVFVVSRVLKRCPEQARENGHVINLFLEYFGACELRSLDGKPLDLPELRSLDWQLLPEGPYPWELADNSDESAIPGVPPQVRPLVLSRLREIARFKPDLVAVGHGGFEGYFVMGFSGRGLFVLECVHLDNATYVFKDDWKEVAQLTKSAVLRGRHHFARFVHDQTWRYNIHRLLAE